MIDTATILQSVGLLMDVVGFYLVFAYGHAVFIHFANSATYDDENGNFITMKIESDESVTRNRRGRRLVPGQCETDG